MCSLSHQKCTKRKAVSKGLSKDGAIHTVCRESSRSNHELSKPNFFSYRMGHPRCSSEGLNATEREHTLIIYGCIKMRSSEVQTSLVRLCFVLRGSPDTDLYYFWFVYRYLLMDPDHPSFLTALRFHRTTYTPIYLPASLDTTADLTQIRGIIHRH